MRIQETRSLLSPAEIVARAVDLIQASGPHASAVEQRSETHVRFRADVGTVGVAALAQGDGTTRVRACAARPWALVGRFLTSLGEPYDVGAEMARRGQRRTERTPVALPAPARERLAAA